MGRRISINRPTAKVRGVDRRLRALDRWADGFAGVEPPCDRLYCNFKIPVLDRLVIPPTTSDAIQGRALRALIRAADYLSHSPVAGQVDYYRVAVLLVLPDMFQSEATAFFHKDYYQGFWNGQGDLDPAALIERFDLVIPAGFALRGMSIAHELDEDVKGMRVDAEGCRWLDEQRWTIGQAP